MVLSEQRPRALNSDHNQLFCITATVTQHGAWGVGRARAESSSVPYSWPIKATQQHSPITEVFHVVEAHCRITLSETARNIWTNHLLLWLERYRNHGSSRVRKCTYCFDLGRNGIPFTVIQASAGKKNHLANESSAASKSIRGTYLTLKPPSSLCLTAGSG